MNWTIIILIGILALALIIFLVIRNQKDKKEFVDKLNKDYPKPQAEGSDIEIN